MCLQFKYHDWKFQPKKIKQNVKTSQGTYINKCDTLKYVYVQQTQEMIQNQSKKTSFSKITVNS